MNNVCEHCELVTQLQGELQRLRAVRAMPEMANVIATLRNRLDEFDGFFMRQDIYPGECRAMAAAFKAAIEVLGGAR